MDEDVDLITVAEADPVRKRFSLAKEKKHREPLKVAVKAIDRLQKSHPEIVGKTFYGSMVTGTAHAESDVDGFVYFAEDKVRDLLTDEDWEWAKSEKGKDDAERREYSNARGVSELDYAAIHKYEPVLKKALLEGGLSKDQVDDIRIRVISEEIIDQEIELALENARKLEQYKREIEERKQKIEDYFATNDWEAVSNMPEMPKYPETPLVDWKIAAMFNLQSGKGLD